MTGLLTVAVVLVVLVVLGFALAARIVKQYERGALFRLGRVVGIPCRTSIASEASAA
jgi:regulator of protease activity HflC (stomatin/prohibitin superfamily)